MSGTTPGRPAPERPQHERPQPDRPVFVVGPPRSGTTLVRVLLSRHPDLFVLTETHLLDIWADRHPGLLAGDEAAFRAYWDDFTATTPFTYLGIDAEAVSHRLESSGAFGAAEVMAAVLDAGADAHGVTRVGEKTPDHARYLGELLDWFPDARIVYVVRDPRATIASELRLDRDWAATDPEVAAERWRRCALPWVRWHDDDRVATVRYEDLVRDPAGTVAVLFDHVQLDRPDGLVEAVVGGGDGHPDYRHGDADPWGTVDASSLDTWRSTLDAADLEAIDFVCGDLATRLGYPPPLATVPWEQRVRLAPRRLRRHAGRLRRAARTLAGAVSP